MARKSIIEREKKKMKLVEKFSQKRASLKDEQRKAATFEEKMDIQRKLQKLQKVQIFYQKKIMIMQNKYLII